MPSHSPSWGLTVLPHCFQMYGECLHTLTICVTLKPKKLLVKTSISFLNFQISTHLSTHLCWVYKFNKLVFFHFLLLYSVHVSYDIVSYIWVPTISDFLKYFREGNFFNTVENWGIVGVSFIYFILPDKFQICGLISLLLWGIYWSKDGAPLSLNSHCTTKKQGSRGISFSIHKVW